MREGWREGGAGGRRRSESESCQNVKFLNVARRSNLKRAPTVGMQCAVQSAGEALEIKIDFILFILESSFEHKAHIV